MIFYQVILSLSLDLLGGEHFRPLKTGDIPVYLALSFDNLDLSRVIFGGEHFQELRFSSFILSSLALS